MTDFKDNIESGEFSIKITRNYKSKESINTHVDISYPSPGVKITTTKEMLVRIPSQKPEIFNLNGTLDIEGSVFEFGDHTGVIAFSGGQFHILNKRMHHITLPKENVTELVQYLNNYPNPIYKGNFSNPMVRFNFFQ